MNRFISQFVAKVLRTAQCLWLSSIGKLNKQTTKLLPPEENPLYLE